MNWYSSAHPQKFINEVQKLAEEQTNISLLASALDTFFGAHSSSKKEYLKATNRRIHTIALQGTRSTTELQKLLDDSSSLLSSLSTPSPLLEEALLSPSVIDLYPIFDSCYFKQLGFSEDPNSSSDVNETLLGVQNRLLRNTLLDVPSRVLFLMNIDILRISEMIKTSKLFWSEFKDVLEQWRLRTGGLIILLCGDFIFDDKHYLAQVFDVLNKDDIIGRSLEHKETCEVLKSIRLSLWRDTSVLPLKFVETLAHVQDLDTLPPVSPLFLRYARQILMYEDYLSQYVLAKVASSSFEPDAWITDIFDEEGGEVYYNEFAWRRIILDCHGKLDAENENSLFAMKTFGQLQVINASKKLLSYNPSDAYKNNQSYLHVIEEISLAFSTLIKQNFYNQLGIDSVSHVLLYNTTPKVDAEAMTMIMDSIFHENEKYEVMNTTNTSSLPSTPRANEEKSTKKDIYVCIGECSEVFVSWYGDSEKRLRRWFQESRQHAPCVLLLLGIEKFGKKRSSQEGSIYHRILNTFLNSLDSVDRHSHGFENLMVIATSNESVSYFDDAIIRPGRLGTHINCHHIF